MHTHSPASTSLIIFRPALRDRYNRSDDDARDLTHRIVVHFQNGTIPLELLAQALDLLGDLDFTAEVHPRPHQADEFEHAPALPRAEVVEIDLPTRRERGRLLLDDIREPADCGQQAAHLVRSHRIRGLDHGLAARDRQQDGQQRIACCCFRRHHFGVRDRLVHRHGRRTFLCLHRKFTPQLLSPVRRS
ncbi:hypothetical protein GCM10007858_61030 [Bradyrhizobium liaoningense]|nr:hypothetical protein GCM10007858_61030 [Bradyrhizobium liaoningense]